MLFYHIWKLWFLKYVKPIDLGVHKNWSLFALNFNLPKIQVVKYLCSGIKETFTSLIVLTLQKSKHGSASSKKYGIHIKYGCNKTTGEYILPKKLPYFSPTSQFDIYSIFIHWKLFMALQQQVSYLGPYIKIKCPPLNWITDNIISSLF